MSFVTRRELCDPIYSGRRGHEVHKDPRRARRIKNRLEFTRLYSYLKFKTPLRVLAEGFSDGSGIYFF